MSDPIIEVSDLTHRFGPMKALDSVSFQVRSGSVFGLVGPNGSGKTTLVRILCGLQKPTSGTARVLGMDVGEKAALIRASVGYMSQRFSLYNDLTARENIEFFARVHGVKGPAGKQRIDEVVTAMGLGPHLSKPCFVLSGGWRQRVSLATTILHAPPLVFLDEPTAGIDPVARRELWDLLFSLAASGTDIFLTSQYMDEIERCAEVGYIYLSKLIITGTPAHLKKSTLNLAKGSRYIELECAQSIHAAPWLRQQQYCSDATVFGSTIHALVKDTVTDARIRTESQHVGFTNVMVRTIEPSLEDVFVALTRQASQQPRA